MTQSIMPRIFITIGDNILPYSLKFKFVCRKWVTSPWNIYIDHAYEKLNFYILESDIDNTLKDLKRDNDIPFDIRYKTVEEMPKYNTSITLYSKFNSNAEMVKWKLKNS